MKRTIVICLLLAGCKATDPIDPQYRALDKQIQATYKALPAECKTAPVMAQIAAIEQQAIAFKATCDTYVQAEKEKNKGLRWKLGFAGIGYLLIATFFYMREKGKWLF